MCACRSLVIALVLLVSETGERRKVRKMRRRREREREGKEEGKRREE